MQISKVERWMGFDSPELVQIILPGILEADMSVNGRFAFGKHYPWRCDPVVAEIHCVRHEKGISGDLVVVIAVQQPACSANKQQGNQAPRREQFRQASLP